MVALARHHRGLHRQGGRGLGGQRIDRLAITVPLGHSRYAFSLLIPWWIRRVAALQRAARIGVRHRGGDGQRGEGDSRGYGYRGDEFLVHGGLSKLAVCQLPQRSAGWGRHDPPAHSPAHDYSDFVLARLTVAKVAVGCTYAAQKTLPPAPIAGHSAAAVCCQFAEIRWGTAVLVAPIKQSGR